MRVIGGFLLGIACSKFILAHVAVQVFSWSPLALKLMVK